MTEISSVGNITNGAAQGYNGQFPTNEELDLSKISLLYSTDKKEDKRSSFSETFSETLLENSTQGSKFLQGLIDNKETLMAELGLSDEKYDSLACIALALASQETGMGNETGYQEENTGIQGVFRKIAKWVDTKIFKHGSASSGLTQMKIHDLLNGDTLTDEQKAIIQKLGVESTGVATNNLYDQPDKAAVATMVVLTSLVDKYDDYAKVLEDNHVEIGKNLNDGLDDASRMQKGQEILENFSSVYQDAPDDKKVEIRSAIKNWLLAQNDSKIGDKGDNQYNEEYQLNELNKLLKDCNAGFALKQSDLDYIRYYLTDDSQKMSVTEYCAYAWNKGTQTTGMQLDRLLADKVGIILSNPEDFDYDQFTVNVSSLAQKYAQQSMTGEVLEYLNSNLEE